MEDKVRVGVIGVGQIGKHHLNNYRKIQAEIIDKIGGVGIVAIADINETEARRIAQLHKIPNGYTKPMAGTYIDALRMIQAAQETGEKLFSTSTAIKL